MNANVIALLERAGLRQVDVAQLLEVSAATASRMFAGQRELTVSEAGILVRELSTRLPGETLDLDSVFGPREARGAA